MTVYSERNKIAYIGNPAQRLYPIPFEYINIDNIAVSIYTDDNQFVESWTYSSQFVVEGDNIRLLDGYSVEANQKILIIRTVDIVQDNRYREGGDFPAKSTETSFDKLTMIAQQLEETLERCVKVEVLDNQTPEELLEEVYSKLDSATEIAEDAIAAANQAQTAADNATSAVESAEQTLVDTQAYVDAAKIEINNTKTTAITEVNNKVTTAKADINTTVVNAQSSINSTKDTAIDAVEDAVADLNSKIEEAKGEINSVVDEATMDISDISTSATSAINLAKAEAEENIATIVSNAEGSIETIAITAATAAIADAAEQATEIATNNVSEYVSTTIRPVLESYTDTANSAKDTAIAQANIATTKAGEASTYTNEALSYKNSASQSATTATTKASEAVSAAAKIPEPSGNNTALIYKDNVVQWGQAGADIPSMTLAEYEAIEKDPNQYYAITDDVDTGTDILQTIYPVGSLYLTTNATCPLANLFGSWSKVGEKLLVDVPSQVAVKGNGLALGLTDGTYEMGLNVEASGNSTYRGLAAQTNAYGLNNGASTPYTGPSLTNIAGGITTDPEKSGMVADINSTSMAVNIFRRIA